MSTTIDTFTTTALSRAARRAALAPSVHNTQPWRFARHGERLEIHADRSRQLHALDPTGRQLMVSLGCAVFNARVSLAADGLGISIERFPAGRDESLVARIAVDRTRLPEHDIAVYDEFIEKRHTSRRRFGADEVPAAVVDELVGLAETEQSILFPIRTEDQRLTVARLSQHADSVQLLDPAYRNEIRTWTTTDANRRDGVQAMAVPHVDGNARDDVPIRDFDSSGLGWLPSQTESSRNQCLLLLGGRRDDAAGWLRTGEALQRIWLEVTRQGLATSPLTQIVEVAHTRAELAADLRLDWYPAVLLRVGNADQSPTSLRRPLRDILTQDD